MQNTFLPTVVLFSTLTILTSSALAATEPDKATPAPASTVADQPTKASQAVKSPEAHSHLQEKLGYTPKPAKAAPTKPNAAEDRSKHYHPRDGK